MATIEIKQQHSLSQDEVKKRVQAFIQEIQKEFGVEYNWSSDELLTFTATVGMVKGTTGKLTLKESSVCVDVDLPLMFRPLKNLIEMQIQEKLHEKLKA